MIITIYEVTYIYGLISPREDKILIEIAGALNEKEILEEIIKKKPQREGVIQAILSTYVKGTKIIKVQKAVDEEVKDKETKKPKQIIVPAGSFVKGRLLNGLDAPSSGAAKSSPHPVAIQIIDKFFSSRFAK